MISTLYREIFEEMKARGSSATLAGGLDKIAENSDAPRVVFYPSSDEFDRGVTNPGGGRNGLPRTLVDRWAGHTVRLWAVTLDQMDTLIAQVVCSVHVVCKRANQATSRSGAYRVQAGRYVNDGAISSARGIEYEYGFAVLMPIVERRWPTPDPDGQAPGDEQSTYRDPTATVHATNVAVKETIGGQTETVNVNVNEES